MLDETTTDEYISWKRGDAEFLNTYFSVHEFTCSCGVCTDQKISKDLVLRLLAIRVALGEPVHINSGYRCQAKQDALKAQGYETSPGISEHTLGNAVDISCAPEIMAQLLILARQHFTSIGVARSFIHVDTRPGVRAWSYTSL